jgi:hypothetical protein
MESRVVTDVPASITLNHHGLTTVGAPEWPFTNYQLMINS